MLGKLNKMITPGLNLKLKNSGSDENVVKQNTFQDVPVE